MKTQLLSHGSNRTEVERRSLGGCRLAPGCWIGLVLLLAALHPVQAQETNEVSLEEKGKRRVFSFEGGNPFDFVMALDKHFRTRLVQILTLPETLSRTRVPKLRVAAEDPREVLNLYNRLESPTLGRWRFEPPSHLPGTNLNVLMLVPDKNATNAKLEPGIKVKGIALAGVPEGKWEALIRDIEEAQAVAQQARGAEDAFAGSTRIQRDSKVLIVFGSDTYLEMVDSFVSAHRLNAEVDARKAAAKGTETAPQ